MKNKGGRKPIPTKEKFWRYVQKTDSCWNWVGGIDKDKYGTIMTCKAEGKIHRKRAHRVSWEIHNGQIPDRLWVLHHCDNPSCVNPEHLFLGTPKDNTQDMIRKGRHGKTGCRGENHRNVKLNWEKVNQIRQLFSTGKFTKRDLGKMFNIGDRQIGYIVRFEMWRNDV